MSKLKTEQKSCVHYWIIDSPDGHTSLGKCKLCGAVKEFSNNFDDALRQTRYSSDSHDNHDDILFEYAKNQSG